MLCKRKHIVVELLDRRYLGKVIRRPRMQTSSRNFIVAASSNFVDYGASTNADVQESDHVFGPVGYLEHGSEYMYRCMFPPPLNVLILFCTLCFAHISTNLGVYVTLAEGIKQKSQAINGHRVRKKQT